MLSRIHRTPMPEPQEPWETAWKAALKQWLSGPIEWGMSAVFRAGFLAGKAWAEAHAEQIQPQRRAS